MNIHLKKINDHLIKDDNNLCEEDLDEVDNKEVRGIIETLYKVSNTFTVTVLHQKTPTAYSPPPPPLLYRKEQKKNMK